MKTRLSFLLIVIVALLGIWGCTPTPTFPPLLPTLTSTFTSLPSTPTAPALPPTPITPAPPTPTALPDCEKLLEAAKGQQKNGDFAKAMGILDADGVSSRCTDFSENIVLEKVEIILAWAQNLLEQKKYSQAVQKLQLAITTSPLEEIKTRIDGNLAEAYLQWAQSLADEQQYEQAKEKCTLAVEAVPTDQTQAIARPMMLDFTFKAAKAALAAQKWDDAILYFNQVITREADLQASTVVSIANRNAKLIDAAGETHTPSSLPAGFSLPTIGQYSDAHGDNWILVLSPIYTSSLGLVAPEYITSTDLEQALPVFQVENLPSLKSHQALLGLVNAYQQKIQALEQDGDYPQIVAAYQTMTANTWLSMFFPNLEKSKKQALSASYDKGSEAMSGLVEHPSAVADLEKYFLPILAEAGDPALVAKAKTALRELYTRQIDWALKSTTHEYLFNSSYGNCDSFQRPPLWGTALLPDRQKYLIMSGEISLPPDLTANAIDEARFVICRDPARHITVQTASYRGVNSGVVRTLSRIQIVQDYQVKDLLTGRLVAKTTIRGSNPEGFKTYEFGNIYGGIPNYADVSAWLDSLRLPLQKRDQEADWLSLGKEAVEAGEFDLAIVSLNAFINLNPRDDRAYLDRSNVFRYQHKWQLALSDMKKALELKPDLGMHMCWGTNASGQLGSGTTASSNVPINISGLLGDVTIIGAGENHTCALTGGSVKCWGENASGQLGNRTTKISYVPVDVSGLSKDVTAVAAGNFHTCALTSNGGVKCWGANYFGQLGSATTTNSQVPVDVKGLPGDVTAITAGGEHTCALMSGGSIKCWGANASGQLGSGTTTDSQVPVDVKGLPGDVTAITAGGEHTCALMSGGSVKCWGANASGQLGNGTTTGSNVPVDVSRLPGDVTAVTAGGEHTCALISDGGVKCWGANYFGQLGNATTTASKVPVDVNGLSGDVTAVTAGAQHTCALMSDGSVKCWGASGAGQLGYGTPTATGSMVPVDVSGLWGDVAAVAAGAKYTCGLFKVDSLISPTLVISSEIVSLAENPQASPPTSTATMVSSLDGMVQVYMPEGEFLMGMTEADIDALVAQCSDCKRERFSDELPQHKIYLDAYWIDKTEVTNGMYALCVEAGKCKQPADTASRIHSSYYGDAQYSNYPVINVDWNEAAAYCQWAGRRLPTEAEWEKAARGSDGRIYPWGNRQPDCILANFNVSDDFPSSCVGDTSAVGSYSSGASPYGVLDMTGNVWEWVSDWYGESYYRTSPTNNPPGQANGTLRVLRGGAWLNYWFIVHSAYRNWDDPTSHKDFIGFRCARSE